MQREESLVELAAQPQEYVNGYEAVVVITKRGESREVVDCVKGRMTKMMRE